jgi:hypothetical protein
MAGTTTLETGLQPERNADEKDGDGNVVTSHSPYYTPKSYNTSKLPQQFVAGPMAFKIYVYDLAENKQVGFCQMKITGTLRYVKPYQPETPGQPTSMKPARQATKKTDSFVFDLQGRRIPVGSLRKGIYVSEGRKVVVH